MNKNKLVACLRWMPYTAGTPTFAMLSHVVKHSTSWLTLALSALKPAGPIDSRRLRRLHLRATMRVCQLRSESVQKTGKRGTHEVK